MKLADEIRSFLIRRWIDTARAAGTRIVKLRVGDVHHAMGLRMRQAAVAGALASRKFEAMANVRPISVEGQMPGANCVFTFELLPVAGSADRPESPEPPGKMIAGKLVSSSEAAWRI